MVHIAVVEDDINYTKQLTGYIQQYSLENNVPVSTVTFPNGDGITNEYSAKYDMILMDIDMPFMDGFSAAQYIRNMDSEVIIIFITNLTQYATKGYAVEAFDYILKPITYFSFCQYFKRALDRLNRRKQHYLLINLKGGVKKQAVSEIMYIECRSHTLTFYTKDGEYTTHGKMGKLEDELSPYGFYRIHSGFLINLEYVEKYQDYFVSINDKMLPVSRVRKKDFLENLSDYIDVQMKG